MKKKIGIISVLVLLFGIGVVFLWQRADIQLFNFERSHVGTNNINTESVKISEIQLEELWKIGLYDPSEVTAIYDVLITPEDIEFFVHLMYMRYDEAFTVNPESLSLGMEIIMADFAGRLFDNDINEPDGFVDFNNAILRAEHEMESSGILHFIGIGGEAGINRDAFLTMLYHGQSTITQMKAHYLGTQDLSEYERLRLTSTFEQQRILTSLWASQRIMILEWDNNVGRNRIRDVSIDNLGRVGRAGSQTTFYLNYAVHSRRPLSRDIDITPGETYALNISFAQCRLLEALYRLISLQNRGYILDILEEYQRDKQVFISQLTANITMEGDLAELGLVTLPLVNVAEKDALLLAKQTVNIINNWNELIVDMDDGATDAFGRFFLTGAQLVVNETGSEFLLATVGLFCPNAFMLIDALEPNGGGLRRVLLDCCSGESARLRVIEERFDSVVYNSDDPDVWERTLGYQLINGGFPLIVDDGGGNAVFNTKEFRLALNDLSIALGRYESPFTLWSEILLFGGLRD